ncbi:MAG: diaminopimelate decarboxylase, partial [Clostridia bacterium]
MLTYEQLKHLYEREQSSFYLLDTERLVSNYIGLLHAFRSRYEPVIIGYSYKTNYVPYLCQTLHSLGAYAEVVSRLEYDLARKLGVSPEQIIFNGPLKTGEDTRLALEEGSILNLDSFSEIEWVTEYARDHPKREVQIGLRVNFDLREQGVSPLQNGYDVSRFGFCVENGNFQSALETLLMHANIRIVGLHGHFSTNRSLAVYERITKQLCSLAKQYLPGPIRYLDVGGGMYGNIPDSFGLSQIPTYDNYAETICSVMQEEFGTSDQRPALILEPGIALVGDVMEFVCKVIDVKENRDTTFVLVDG